MNKPQLHVKSKSTPSALRVEFTFTTDPVPREVRGKCKVSYPFKSLVPSGIGACYLRAVESAVCEQWRVLFASSGECCLRALSGHYFHECSIHVRCSNSLCGEGVLCGPFHAYQVTFPSTSFAGQHPAGLLVRLIAEYLQGIICKKIPDASKVSYMRVKAQLIARDGEIGHSATRSTSACGTGRRDWSFCHTVDFGVWHETEKSVILPHG